MLKWVWFAASAFAMISVFMIISVLSSLSQRTTDSKSNKESELAIMLCVYLILWVLLAAGLAEDSIR